MTAQGDQLARVLGPGWPRMTCGQLFDRAYTLERSATFAMRFAHDVADVEAETAGEALARLQGRVGWPTASQAPL